MFLSKEQVRSSLDENVDDFEAVMTVFESLPRTAVFEVDVNIKNVYAMYYDGFNKSTNVFKLKYDYHNQNGDSSLEEDLSKVSSKGKKVSKNVLRKHYTGFFNVLFFLFVGLFFILLGVVYFL
jgi:hypothetical protein